MKRTDRESNVGRASARLSGGVGGLKPRPTSGPFVARAGAVPR
ncbi:MAG TPA: hypothetical protein VEO54_21775 [Thermoanaerobaculia bacterium]|nr:hypothetical protein [Thermoanaerobaculia bacterium]